MILWGSQASKQWVGVLSWLCRIPVWRRRRSWNWDCPNRKGIVPSEWMESPGGWGQGNPKAIWQWRGGMTGQRAACSSGSAAEDQQRWQASDHMMRNSYLPHLIGWGEQNKGRHKGGRQGCLWRNRPASTSQGTAGEGWYNQMLGEVCLLGTPPCFDVHLPRFPGSCLLNFGLSFWTLNLRLCLWTLDLTLRLCFCCWNSRFMGIGTSLFDSWVG